MMRFGLMTAAAVVLAADPAVVTADLCAPRAALVAGLRHYDQVPAAAGLSEVGVVLELLVSADRETWTLIETHPDGQACLITRGEGWGPAPAPRRHRPERPS